MNTDNDNDPPDYDNDDDTTKVVHNYQYPSFVEETTTINNR
jgi:hypothetical protein